MTNRRVLVVGARPMSLGDQIAKTIIGSESGHFYGAPVVRTEHPSVIHDSELDENVYLPLDVAVYGDVRKALEEVRPTDVVCCAGINIPDYQAQRSELVLNMRLQLQSNTWGPISMLIETLDFWEKNGRLGNFVMISSNSAHIARSQSAGYCASKAALSMAVRCIARAEAKNHNVQIWGYEPGWIVGTPMSQAVERRLALQGGFPHHRIPSGDGLSKYQLALKIVSDMEYPMIGLHGMMIRIDGGEQ